MTSSRFPIEAGHVLQFARAIGDFDRAYEDAAAGVGEPPVPPPTFVQAGEHFAPTSVLRPRPGERWIGSRDPSPEPDAGGDTSRPASERSGEDAGVLHAEQHFEYHRHPRIGEVLTASTREGASWQKTGRRAGLLTFSEQVTEYRDLDGELVITARSVGVRTERVIEPSGDES